MKILHLEITDLLFSMGATHYYGHIVFPSESKKENIELGYTMSKADATALNKKEKMYAAGYRATYHAGDRSTRYDTKEQVIASGIKYYDEKLRNKNTILVVGRSGVIEPKKVIGYHLKTPLQIKLITEINKIAAEYHYNDDCDTEHNKSLYNKWKPLWKKLTGESWG
jgi:hypothetical protein